MGALVLWFIVVYQGGTHQLETVVGGMNQDMERGDQELTSEPEGGTGHDTDTEREQAGGNEKGKGWVSGGSLSH